MKIGIETNLIGLDKLIKTLEDALEGRNPKLLAELQGKLNSKGHLPTIGLTPIALLQRMIRVRETIAEQEFQVVRAASELDHTIADELGSPRNPDAQPFQSALTLLHLDTLGAKKNDSIPAHAFSYSLLEKGPKAESLRWSFDNGAEIIGNLPQPPPPKKRAKSSRKG